jgi:hypothetical protein
MAARIDGRILGGRGCGLRLARTGCRHTRYPETATLMIDPLIGRALSRYELQDRLGRGGMVVIR